MAYPDDWPQIARNVKATAGWRCEKCGHPDSYEEGYSLTVHHKDGDTTNNSRENLIALCQRCHLRRQSRLRLYGPEDDRQLRLPFVEDMATNKQRQQPPARTRRMTM